MFIAMGEVLIELRNWQPLMGAALGFGALTWGALYNYRLGRKRDDVIREQEARSVALGLYSEINLISKELAKSANSIGNWYMRKGVHGDDLPSYFSDSFVLPESTLFKALAPKVGMLSPNVLMSVTRFYGYYTEALNHLPNILENPERPVSYGIEWFLGPAISAIDEVQPALREIERIGNVTDAAPKPDLEQARKAIRLQDELHPSGWE
jgi:hypothetical protein